jgi:GrpB-like predicted nucleotidyltransferase (UPF0157 family)
MNDDESLRRAINEKVEIVDFDPSWAATFAEESRRLRSLFPGAFFRIEHVGSTAVPELPAKPIVDLIAAIESMEAADALLPSLCANGYATSAEFNATLVDRRWLMRHTNGRRTHHLHLVLRDGKDWIEKLAFRDLLRTEPALRADYAALKRELAASFGANRDGYTDAKGDFIRAALERIGL